MKTNRILIALLALGAAIGFVACNSESEPIATHTVASKLVIGNYEGIMKNDTGLVLAEDVVVRIARVEKDSVQADTVFITSTTLNMDLVGIFNAAKAGNRFLLVGANGASSDDMLSSNNKSVIVLENDILSMDFVLNKKFAFSNATTAKHYYFTLSKVK